MWDFSIGTSLDLMARTWPFVLLRLVIYALAAGGMVLGTGVGVVLGWGVGLVFGGDGEITGGLIGGVAGLCLVLGVLWWVRQYLVYLVKAGHVAAMDALLRGGAIPSGRLQIDDAIRMVKTRFLEVNILFGIDLLIRGTVRAFVGILGLLTNWIPGMRTLNAFVAAVLRVALGLVDEIILAYIIRHDGVPPGEAARDGLVLYAQNAGALVRNAAWITLFEYALAALIFLFLLGPAIGLAYALPGGWTAFGVVFAFIAAWALKGALIEPVSIASLLQAYEITTRGQLPDPGWTARLDDTSRAFRDLAAPPAPPRAA